jgi:hypothetical protein
MRLARAFIGVLAVGCGGWAGANPEDGSATRDPMVLHAPKAGQLPIEEGPEVSILVVDAAADVPALPQHAWALPVTGQYRVDADSDLTHADILATHAPEIVALACRAAAAAHRELVSISAKMDGVVARARSNPFALVVWRVRRDREGNEISRVLETSERPIPLPWLFPSAAEGLPDLLAGAKTYARLLRRARLTESDWLSVLNIRDPVLRLGVLDQVMEATYRAGPDGPAVSTRDRILEDTAAAFREADADLRLAHYLVVSERDARPSVRKALVSNGEWLVEAVGSEDGHVSGAAGRIAADDSLAEIVAPLSVDLIARFLQRRAAPSYSAAGWIGTVSQRVGAAWSSSDAHKLVRSLRVAGLLAEDHERWFLRVASSLANSSASIREILRTRSSEDAAALLTLIAGWEGNAGLQVEVTRFYERHGIQR